MEQKENIESNIKDLDIANEVYNKIKDYLLKGLTSLQLDALNNSKEEIKYQSFRNEVLDIVPLPKDYFFRFRQDLYDNLYFDVYSNTLNSIIFVSFSKKRLDRMASCRKTLNSDLPVLDLCFIDNVLNKFNLNNTRNDSR